MGNWRTVNIIGTCDAEDLPPLQRACYWGKEYENFHPLAFGDSPSICGLNDWPAEAMSLVGNLAERNYSVQDVAQTLRRLVPFAPSLKLKVHCGGDYEDPVCVATITVEKGSVTAGLPEVRELPPITEGQMADNYFRALSARRGEASTQ